LESLFRELQIPLDTASTLYCDDISVAYLVASPRVLLIILFPMLRAC